MTPAPEAIAEAPSWCEAKTQPNTIAPTSGPNHSRHSITVGGTVATQSSP